MKKPKRLFSFRIGLEQLDTVRALAEDDEDVSHFIRKAIQERIFRISRLNRSKVTSIPVKPKKSR